MPPTMEAEAAGSLDELLDEQPVRPAIVTAAVAAMAVIVAERRM
jgi:hypothetical protein